MKEFLTKVAVFLLILLAGMAIPFLLPGRDAGKYRLGNDAKTVFIGDSHIQCAIQDELIDQAKSLAISSEATYFSYYKIKKLLAESPGIETVYLGFSYHNISSYYDAYIYGEFASNILPRYFDLLPLGERLKYLPGELNAFYRNYVRAKVGGTQQGFYNQFGDTQARMESMDKRLVFQYYQESGELRGFSEINIRYLKKISDLLVEKGVNFILINAPLHPYYREALPAAYTDQYRKLLEEMKVEVVDFEGLELDDSCFIPDGDHVSTKGTEMLSRYLGERIRQ